jgi:hypothetical protein
MNVRIKGPKDKNLFLMSFGQNFNLWFNGSIMLAAIQKPFIVSVTGLITRIIG